MNRDALLDMDAVVAVADLVKRSGAKEFEIGYLHDDVPIDAAGWYAHAKYRGARLTCDDQPSPQHAADGLAATLLDGGRCRYCGAKTSSAPTEFGRYEGGDPGPCVWRRDGARWLSGCKK